jgi:hypothetical protein
MATDVKLPDGSVVTVPTDDLAAATQAGRRYWARQQNAGEAFRDGPARPLAMGTQDVGKGLADVAGMPVDLLTGAANLGSSVISGASRLPGMIPGVPDVSFDMPQIEEPFMGADSISNMMSTLSEFVGFKPFEEEERSRGERQIGDINRFGTAALTSGAGLSAAAGAKFAPSAAAPKPQFGDALLRPYAQSPGRTLAGDIGAGVGSGLGIDQSQENFPDSPIMDMLGVLVGGLGGSIAANVVRSPKDLALAVNSLRADPSIALDPDTLGSTSRRVAEHTARMAQGAATDPAKASARIGQRVEAARNAGEPAPTSGIASDDIGMVAMERGARGRDPVPFQESDQQLKDAAQDRVTGLRDPGANQSAATEFAQQRPRDLADARDADALPLLRQAENSGATVDAQPVADVIDTMLGEAKRPAVRDALTKAREMLKPARVDPDNPDALDTSVSGLYETRKAISDIIDGRTDTPTGRYAKKELIEVRNALDAQINEAAPEFGQYLTKYKEGSKPINALRDSDTVASLMEKDPRNVAKRIFGGKEYGTEQLLDQVNEAIGTNPEAMRGWRAAVAEVLADQVTTTNTALTGAAEGPVSIAALQKVFKQHEKGLARVFGPEDMNALRRAHKMLEPLGNLGRQSVAGSATAENQQLANAFEAAVLAYTGNAIKTGMIMKRIRVGLNLLPGVKQWTLQTKMKRLIDRMWFDPDLARHLLDRPVSEIKGPGWNWRLNVLLGSAAGSREMTDDDSFSSD